MRDDIQFKLIVTWVKEGGDFFAVKGTPLVVMACDLTVYVGNELSACKDVKARRVGHGIEMKVVKKVPTGGGGHVHGIHIRKPDPADGVQFLLGDQVFASNPLGLPVGSADEAGLKKCGRRDSLPAPLIPCANLPDIALLWPDRSAGVSDIYRLRRLDLPRVPRVCVAGSQVLSVRRDGDFIR